ncbi:type II membrane protein [Linderina macrospora]|uniref:Type II membrane protein n=1 Tax=Linderina macrospora TaxID=4868 RepID=A0ACC1JDE3_9FUNG|nr:type II membrane protein [Linderina macrospora]
MKPSLRAFALLLASLGVTAAAFDCKSLKIADHAYDLSALAHDVTLESNATTPPTITGTRYTLNPCGAIAAASDKVPEIDRCPGDSWVCRSVTNYKPNEKARITEVNAVAGGGAKEADKEPTLEAKASSGNDTPKEFHWKMHGVTIDKVEWKTDIKFVCDKDAKNDALPVLKKFEDGELELEWKVPAACALGDNNDKGSDGGDNKDKDGKDRKPEDEVSGRGFFGTIFSLLFVGFVFYFVLGLLYNFFVVHATGLDLVPNLAFWREFPYLVMDFSQHIWDIVSGRRRGGYSVV